MKASGRDWQGQRWLNDDDDNGDNHWCDDDGNVAMMMFMMMITMMMVRSMMMVRMMMIAPSHLKTSGRVAAEMVTDDWKSCYWGQLPKTYDGDRGDDDGDSVLMVVLMIVSVVLVVMILMMCEEDVSKRHSRDKSWCWECITSMKNFCQDTFQHWSGNEAKQENIPSLKRALL